MGKSSPRPPPAPDYAAAATAQGAANVQAATTGASLSNPNIISPYGNQTVTYGGTGPGGAQQPTVTQTLTPAAQQTLDAQQQVQLSEANLAQQGIHSASDTLSTQFDPNLPALNTTAPQGGPLDYGPAGGQFGAAQGFDPSQYGSASGLDASGLGGALGVNAAALGAPQQFNGQQYGQAGGINAGLYGQARGIGAGPSAQRALDLSGVASAPVNAGMTGQQAILSRLEPQLQRNEDAARNRLANQGLAPDSEAYQNDFRQLGQQRNDLETQAALQGIGLDMSANQQGYNQALGAAGLYNSALGQNFSQNLAADQSRNQAIGQNFGQGVTAQQLNNQATSQNFGQGLQGAGFNNDAQSQAFAQALQAGGFNNQAQAQNFGQAQSINDSRNAAIGQNAALGLQGVQSGNQAIGQNFGQASTAAGLYNGAQGQQFNQALQGSQFGNSAIGQALQQALAQRSQPLNEITALMSGSQISNPQFQSYQGQNVQAAPIYQAANDQYQAALNSYGIQQQAANANSSGLFGLLGTAAGGFLGGPGGAALGNRLFG